MTLDELLAQAQATTDALMTLDRMLSEFAASNPDPVDAGEALIRIHTLKGDMGDVYSVFSSRIIEVLQAANVDDLAVGENRIEVRSAADRKQWKHDALIDVVANKLVSMSVDMDTGEVVLSPQQIAAKVLDFVQPSYWRVKELSKIGVNADNFCEVGEHKTNIIVRKAK